MRGKYGSRWSEEEEDGEGRKEKGGGGVNSSVTIQGHTAKILKERAVV